MGVEIADPLQELSAQADNLPTVENLEVCDFAHYHSWYRCIRMTGSIRTFLNGVTPCGD